MRPQVFSLLSVLLVSGGVPHVLAAEMGSAPASSGVFVTLDGGLQHVDGDSVLGHGISPTPLPDDNVSDVGISAEDGWFLGGSVGYRNATPFVSFLPFNRWEAYLSYSDASETKRNMVTGTSTIDLSSVDASTLAVIGDTGRTEVERNGWEFGTRAAIDTGGPGRTSLTWVLQTFTRYSEEETATSVVGTVDASQRSSRVETQATGVLATVEPEVRLSPALAMVGRAGAGIYYFDVDGDFASRSTFVPDVFAARLSDDDDGVGFRAQLGLGLKYRVSEAVTLTGYGEADYFSNVGTADLPANRFSASTPASVGTEGSWELRAGARLSVSLTAGQ